VTGEIDGVEFSVPAERTTHTSIPPAHVRIQKFQRKKFEQYDETLKNVRAKDAEMYR
jgi:hypothetical protein